LIYFRNHMKFNPNLNPNLNPVELNP